MAPTSAAGVVRQVFRFSGATPPQVLPAIFGHENFHYYNLWIKPQNAGVERCWLVDLQPLEFPCSRDRRPEVVRRPVTRHPPLRAQAMALPKASYIFGVNYE